MPQYLGLILVLTTWAAGAYLVIKWRDRTLPTISRHAASSKHASMLFAAVLIGCGLLFYAWLMWWFVPHLQPGQFFKIILTVTILCQVLTALAPDTQGLSRTVHHYAAYIGAVLFFPLLALIIMAPEISLIARTFCIAAGLYMLATFVTVAVMGKARSNYLQHQIAYIMVFQSAILAAAYL